MRVILLSAALLGASISGVSAQTAPPSTPAPTATPRADSSVSPQPAPTTLMQFARGRIDTMLRTGHADPAWFAASFLAQIPAAQVDALIAQMTAQLGTYRSIDEGASAGFIATFERGTVRATVHLDAANKIDGLAFHPGGVSLDDALRALRPASGRVSYVIREGRSERAALDASAPLAVGSSFKLAAFAALRDEIRRGRRRWTDVIPLDAAAKSLPSGVLQSWPAGTPVTLATYAAQMLSISDNTAADTIVRLDGAALSRYALRNIPFFTTRELFVLKSTSGATLRARYLAARSIEERRAVLRAVDAAPLPAADELEPSPILTLEWTYSVRELCDLMDRVADDSLVTINPGAAKRSSFRRVAYKGGSDVGAVNLTTQVVTKRGTVFCVSATLNDDAHAVDASAFIAAYGDVLAALAGR